MKIKSIDDLAGLAASLRAANKTIVHCHGTFELLHIGAIRVLEEAKKLGDFLIVTVQGDPKEPEDCSQAIFPEDARAEALAALSMVDYVAVSRGLRSVEAIELLRPDVFVPGDDEAVQGNRIRTWELEETAVAAAGGSFHPVEVSVPRLPELIRGSAVSVSPQAAEFLSSFSATYSPEAVLRQLESIRSRRVLLIGETIIDEYQYCETMGKSGKEPILAVRYVSAEKFAGGVLATANQTADFVDHVGVLSYLGTCDSHEEFIRERLSPRIDAMFLYVPGVPTTIKRRFVELYPFQKLFEVYVMNDEIEETCSKALYARLKAVLPHYDAVIVTDYGHGMLTPEIVDLLCSQNTFLAVNTQTNAANQGFNTVSKYHRADYICLSEKELRLEARSRTKDLRIIVTEIAERLLCERMLVTRGQQGCLCYRKGEGFFPVPAFAQRVVDRIGAGDAVLAVTSACVAQDMPMEVVGFIGNVVGALAVETVGHRSIVGRSALCQEIMSLLNCKHANATQWV